MQPKSVIAASIACLALASGLERTYAADNFITIGTGDMAGVYYTLGGGICRFVNAGRREHGNRCTVKSTAGSMANIGAVVSGELKVGISQGETQYNAFNGLGSYKEKQPKLRALFSVYPELLTLVTRQDANIRNVTDLKGKRADIGEPGSGTRVVMETVLAASSLRRDDLGLAAELKPIDLAQALCANKIDAFAYFAGHPNAIFVEAANSCATSIASIAGAGIDALLRDRPYYFKASVPGKLYKGTDNPQPTFGVMATVVASADLPEQVAYVITKAVFENIDELKTLHPAMSSVTREKMLEGNSAPFHPGALKYYREKGLLQ